MRTWQFLREGRIMEWIGIWRLMGIREGEGGGGENQGAEFSGRDCLSFKRKS